MNNNYFEICINNKKSYLKHHNKSRDKIEFINTFAEEYQISNSDNKFYFSTHFLFNLFMKVIKNILVPGFFPLSFHDDGIDITINSYRGTLSKEHLGYIGDGSTGTNLYR